MSTKKSLPKKIESLQAVASNYDALLCDVWGVIHNGYNLFPGVAEALQGWRDNVGPVLLLTNAPRPAEAVQRRLDRMDCPREAYDGILSSGDAAREILSQRGAEGQVCYFVGATKDVDVLNGIDIEFAPAEEADFILLTGMSNDMEETLEDYADEIALWLKLDLQLICANPDRIVQIGEQVIYCAGALAEIYENKGGDVIWLGKPHLPIYDTGFNRLQKLTNMETPRILAIGDGFKTDIPGANSANLDVLFITGGLSETLTQETKTPEDIAAILRDYDSYAHYFMKHLSW
ncbi:MAG: TIGR01459 family HAD-type hydrolase [Pseudomonadota bacterium]|nr:TIGR01459 family HAD-type hydrolase [Pseudomonadota bacterium]